MVLPLSVFIFSNDASNVQLILLVYLSLTVNRFVYGRLLEKSLATLRLTQSYMLSCVISLY